MYSIDLSVNAVTMIGALSSNPHSNTTLHYFFTTTCTVKGHTLTRVNITKNNFAFAERVMICFSVHCVSVLFVPLGW